MKKNDGKQLKQSNTALCSFHLFPNLATCYSNIKGSSRPCPLYCSNMGAGERPVEPLELMIYGFYVAAANGILALAKLSHDWEIDHESSDIIHDLEKKISNQLLLMQKSCTNYYCL